MHFYDVQPYLPASGILLIEIFFYVFILKIFVFFTHDGTEKMVWSLSL